MARLFLRGIPDDIRTPLIEYQRNGVLPTAAWMVAMLCGQLTHSAELYNREHPKATLGLHDIYTAMEAMCDDCIGHEVYVARWVSHHGALGRVALVP